MADELLYRRSACTALVITCSDFRFKTVERRFLETAGLTDDYDLIARPGAIRSLVAPRTAAAHESMEDEIRLLWNVHHFPRILAVNHMSCRAYDDLAVRTDVREVHLAHLHAARPAIEQLCEGVTVEPYLITLVNVQLLVELIGVN